MQVDDDIKATVQVAVCPRHKGNLLSAAQHENKKARPLQNATLHLDMST